MFHESMGYLMLWGPNFPASKRRDGEAEGVKFPKLRNKQAEFKNRKFGEKVKNKNGHQERTSY